MYIQCPCAVSTIWGRYIHPPYPGELDQGSPWRLSESAMRTLRCELVAVKAMCDGVACRISDDKRGDVSMGHEREEGKGWIKRGLLRREALLKGRLCSTLTRKSE